MTTKDEEEPSVTKRPVILGYERVAEIASDIAVIKSKLAAALADRDDHEVRIRALELAFAKIAGQNGLWAVVVPNATSLFALAVAAAGFFLHK